MRSVFLVLCCSWWLSMPARADEPPPAEPAPVAAPTEAPAPAQPATPEPAVFGSRADPPASTPIEERIEAAQPAIARAASPCACTTEPPAREHVIEVTFGSSQLFIHQSILNKSGNVAREIIPVTSALIMLEWLFWRRFSLLSLFNLPLVTEKTVVDGQTREKFVAPSLATGLRFSAIRLDVFAHSKLEFQVAAMVGFTLGGTDAAPVFPMAAGRIHFSNQAGFALYLGTAFAFQKDTVGVFYGIGHRF
jgi:hypothetical protein